ncbi:MAG TPA: hypothetical protein EYP60_04025 [bacterium (Candidatus Stahlbacteria)]|nr:hypothetical protein [Candidatus Stahlbacteria bacterium]
MTEKELRKILKKGRSASVEFMQATVEPTDLARWIVGFANAEGGIILIGISDYGSISGIEIAPQNVEKLIHCPFDYCEPPVEVEQERVSTKSGTVLVFNVKASNRVHSTTDGIVYLRIGDEIDHLHADEILKLAYTKGQISFEKQVVDNATLKHLDENLLKMYQQKLKTTLDIQDILRARGLIEVEGDGTKLTTACILLFAKEPQKFIPNCGIDFVRFEGTKMETEPQNIIKREIVEKPLPRLIDDVIELIKNQIKRRKPLYGLPFEERSEYPEFAWQEAIINAVAHRDYSVTGNSIQIRMFDDRLEIESPGRLPGTVKTENIVEERFTRNPIIFRVLLDLGYVRDLGEGIDRMIDEMKHADLPAPSFSEPNYSFEVVLKNTAIYGEKIEKWLKRLKGVELSEQQRRALAFILKYGEINNTQYREINRVNRDRAIKDLHTLVSLKLIKQFGKKRGARYVLSEETRLRRV